MPPEEHAGRVELFSLRAFLPGAGMARTLCGLFDHLSGLRKLRDVYHTLPGHTEGREFLADAQDALGITCKIAAGSVENIPRTGPAVIVANHPFGGADGIILARLITALRPDVRILANYYLKKVPQVESLIIGVDPFSTEGAAKRNAAPLREAVKWLQRGGLLLTFPAGEVSHFHSSRFRVEDSEWSNTIGRIIRLTRATAVPVYFHGRNSLLFNLLGFLHPLLRTCLLPRELTGKMNTGITLSIGRAVSGRQLKKLDDADAVTRYLRLRTYMLANSRKEAPRSNGPVEDYPGMAQVISPAPVSLLKAELEVLPDSQLLLKSGTMQVYIAKAGQAPWLMQEIGRLREVSFRLAGEGTGKSVDIDLFDSYYRHLFIWDTQQQQVVGAYRIGIVREILEKYGRRGLYTYTLFKFRRKLLAGLGNAVELGRSFVHPDYQRSYLPLNLLWKGIGAFVSAEKYSVLFGPVSISREYTLQSRRLLVDCLRKAHRNNLAGSVKPRHPFRNRKPMRQILNDRDSLFVQDIDLVSDIISQFEHDEKGVPVLVRQYLKLGGKFLGFNVDREFNDVVDGLILVDLTKTEVHMLEKYMGRDGAAEFLQYHGERQEHNTLLRA